MPDEHSFHDRLVAALKSENETALAEVLGNARAADLAESFDILDEAERSRILFVLPPRTAAEVMVMLDEAVRGDVVDDLDTESLTELVSKMPPDDAADVLSELTEDEAGEILGQLVDERSEKIEELLHYDEETAGGIMTPDVVAVPAEATVADAVEYVRRATADEELHDVYIVDDTKKVVGIVPLRRLVTSPPKTLLADICEGDPVVVSVDDDQETVVQIIRKYDVSEAAVVDKNGKLIGRITHDDLLDVAEEEAEEDLLRMAGTDAAELETSSAFRAAWVRGMWLVPCMAGMLGSATVMTLAKTQFNVALFATLVLFVPMIGATGGNNGIQITTIIVRGFATGELGSMKFLRALRREGRIATAMAPACGILAWTLVTLFFFFRGGTVGPADPGRVAMAVGIGMTASILMSTLMAVLLPFTFLRVGVDPAVASGPLVTMLNDVISVTVYMLISLAIAT